MSAISVETLYSFVLPLLGVAGVSFAGGRYYANQQLNRKQQENLGLIELKGRIKWTNEMKADLNDKVMRKPSGEAEAVYRALIDELDIQIKALERSLNNIVEKQQKGEV